MRIFANDDYRRIRRIMNWKRLRTGLTTRSAIAILLAALYADDADAVNVTFKVDMTGVNGASGAYVAGEFNNWARVVEMTHEGNNIYSYTVDLPSHEVGEYYFLKRKRWNLRAKRWNYWAKRWFKWRRWNRREWVPPGCAGGRYNNNRIYDAAASQLFAFEYGTCTPIEGVSNSSPTFNSDPISTPNAIDGTSYSHSLTGDASDPDGDPLTFAKDSGPAWLNVATDPSADQLA